MLAARGYNIESLAVGETDNPSFSRMTFVVVGNNDILAQVQAQLQKIVTVVHVDDISEKQHVERDLMLIRVSPPREKRSEVLELVNIFRASVVDVTPDRLMIELSGKESKVEAFIEVMRPYGIEDLVRTGRVALPRSWEQESVSRDN